MKKLFRSLLALALIFGLYVPQVLAFHPLFNEPISILAEADSLLSTSLEQPSFVGTGNLELDLKFSLPIKNVANPNIKVTLKDSANASFTIDLNDYPTMTRDNYTLGDQKGEFSIRKMEVVTKEDGNISYEDVKNGVDSSDVKYYAMTIYGLRQGTYSVTLSGNGYKDYTVTGIKLDDYAKRVTLSNDRGLFEVGDVNGDNAVDEKDIDGIIAHIGSKDAADLNKYDLDRDGEIQINDMAMAASSINGEVEKVSIENTMAIISADSFSIDESSTSIDGDIADLFTPDGSVGVHPSDTEAEISEENPAVISLDMKKPVEMGEIRIETGHDNVPEEMTVIVLDENDKEHEFKVAKQQVEAIAHKFTDKSSEGTIVVDLEGQIAVKKVTIKITKSSGKNLAEIAEVEFLNNVKEDVAPPEINIPSGLKANLGSEQVTLTWNGIPNVTGYEVLFQTLDTSGNVTKNEILQTTYTNYTVEDLKNYKDYRAAVRGVNGDWKGAYSAGIDFQPKASRKPPAPDMVNVTPTFAGLDISWKDMKDTLTYNIYYRALGAEEFEEIREYKGTSYKLRNLLPSTAYEVYISGNNPNGEGARSLKASGTTLAEGAAITPQYKLINKPNGGDITSHIKEVVSSLGTMSNGDNTALVDDDFHTYWEHTDWQVNASANYSFGAPIIVLDQEYTMDRFALTIPDSYTFSYKGGSYDPDSRDYNDVKVFYWSGDDVRSTQNSTMVHGTLELKKDKNNRSYYVLKLQKPIKANAVQFGITVANNKSLIQISEVKLYEYDSILGDVNALFTDDLHLVLADDVNEARLKELEERLNTIDKESGEYHPDKAAIQADIDYARRILNDEDLSKEVITVNQNITAKKHTGFSQLSELQPLGIVARPGETITIYMGTDTSVRPQVVFTQFYAEAGGWNVTKGTLNKGANVIEVPKVNSMDVDKGGAVYIKYPNQAPTKGTIKIRVSGGERIPMLDLYSNLSDEVESKAIISSYLTDLKNYVQKIRATDGFDENLSVINSTEIGTKNALFSVPATKVYDSIISGIEGDTTAQINRVYNSLLAFEEMMTIFYNHKGLSLTPEESVDMAPASRINIRAMRMFDGAFMYASGDHIGIGQASVPGLMQGIPNQGTGADMTTTGYFGWGISHEIGHQINQGNLAHAEVTNNVFALLAQTSDDKTAPRIADRMDRIYQKVTSNTLGKGTDVFVTLAMYWQLHLAYDDNYTFSDTNSIFAKINKESRRVNQDETLKSMSKDELLIALASKASGYDLREYYRHWGLASTEKVDSYIAGLNLKTEERPIWYINDSARRYRMNGGAKTPETTSITAFLSEEDPQNKRYTLTFNPIDGSDSRYILGYEIKRNGVPIMFTTETSFTDVIGALNNQALTYEVTAYDMYLKPTNTVKLKEVKVRHDGSINKEGFTIESNFKHNGEVVSYEDESFDSKKLSVNNLLDGKNSTFIGDTRISDKEVETVDKGDASIIIDLNSAMSVSGIAYTAGTDENGLLANTISKYAIYVSKDRNTWDKVKEGTFVLKESNNYKNTIYFDKIGTTGGNQLWTYNDISYIKIVSVGNKNGISGAEIDVIAPPGDNVELDNVGKLSKDYKYQGEDGSEKTIEAGSIVFTGNYRGNPTFNVMLMVDATNAEKVFDGENFLFAKLTDDGSVSEVADGTWFYVVSKETYEDMRKGSVRAELYRVNDPHTNDGERLTSTSLSLSDLAAYEELPDLNIVDSTKEVS